MARLPTGTVTLVFTDIEGSTRLLHHLGDAYENVLATHRRLLRDAFSAHAGIEVDTQGDALFYAFGRARDAVAGTIEAQRALASQDFGRGVQLRVRMGIHTGDPTVTVEGYVGADVHLAARICSAGHGGQVILSDATAHLVPKDLDGISLRSLGEHRLKDIDDPVVLHQLDIERLRSDFPPLRTPSTSHPTNLPPRPPLLIGRDEELSTLQGLLASPKVSVVTLVGPGGTGKTTLAAAVGAELLSSFPEGVFFVDLSSLTDAALVVPAIAQALSLRESPGRLLQETLGEHLSSKELLLILDNFEQVIGAAPEVSALVAAAPALKVLVTSREALRVRGEKEIPLAPLALPSLSDEPEVVSESPAVALFVSRAQDVRPDFQVNPSELTQVADICRRLDGLPLAIELAAARIKMLSLPALNERLAQSLKLLTSGRRDASDRQRTLRGAISWSYDLLSQDEQALFRRLGMFAGGFTLEAAEVVCDRGDLDTDVLDGLASLVDKSLVRTDEPTGRFSMLETIRDFALEGLEASGEADDVRRAHAGFFLELAQAVYSIPRGEETETRCLNALQANHDNLRSALSWAIETQPDVALALAASLGRYWYVRGHLHEGRAWLERTLAKSNGAVNSDRANASRYLGVIRSVQGDNEGARAAATVARDLYQSLGDESGVARSLEVLGLAHENAGDFPSARKTYEQALESYERARDERGAAVARANLGELLFVMGEASEARTVISESLRAFERVDDKEGVASSLLNLAWVALASGDIREARDSVHRSIRLATALRHADLINSCLEVLAALAAARSRPDRAAMLLGVSAANAVRLGVVLSSYEKHMHDDLTARVRASLGQTAWQSLTAAGAQLSLEAALELGAEDDNL